MAEVVLDIKQWGNNLGVRLPAVIAREAHFFGREVALPSRVVGELPGLFGDPGNHRGEDEIKLEMLKEEIKRVSELGKFKDRWVHHPLPSMSEANKAMCWLTEHDKYDLTHQAWLYNKASLHSVDSFF